MKPEKPKKAKASAKRTRASAKEELPAKPKTTASKKASPLKKARVVAARIKAAITRIKQPVPPPPVAPKAAPVREKAAPAPPPARPVRTRISVPPILLEGDTPATPRPSGPGKRYVIGSDAPVPGEEDPFELPEAYGTQRLLLVARDPHWLYAHWDMTAEQLRQHNKKSRDGHLIVRAFRDQPAGDAVIEQHVHPESRNWFVHVGR